MAKEGYCSLHITGLVISTVIKVHANFDRAETPLAFVKTRILEFLATDPKIRQHLNFSSFVFKLFYVSFQKAYVS